MLRVETIRKIYTCYEQIAECHKILKELDTKVEKSKELGSFDNPFDHARALDVGIPDFNSSSRRIIGVSLGLGYEIIQKAIERYTKELEQLEAVSKIEMSQNNMHQLIGEYVEERLKK